MDGSDALDVGSSASSSFRLTKSDDVSNATLGLDFASYLFGSKEAEDFSMFQLQPDLFSGDLFGGGLDQYYTSVLPRGDGAEDANAF